MTRELWDNGQAFTYTYDENSNRLTADDGKIKYVYTYDHTDLLETVDRIQALNPTVSFKYKYDDDRQSHPSCKNGLVTRYSSPKRRRFYKYTTTRVISIPKISPNWGWFSSIKMSSLPTSRLLGVNTTIERYVEGLLKVKTTNAYDGLSDA